MYHILFFHLTFDGHLSCLYLAIVSNVGFNMCIQVFVWTYVSSFGYIPRSVIARSFVYLFEEFPTVFTMFMCNFIIPTNSEWGFQFLLFRTSNCYCLSFLFSCFVLINACLTYHAHPFIFNHLYHYIWN